MSGSIASLEQEIRFCTASDGVRIAYATTGSGPPLVKAANWLNHLEFDWLSPVWRHWLEELSLNRQLIRYDERASGLSDWRVEDVSFDAYLRDLEAVVAALSLERFPLLGISQGAAVAAAFAARHPEMVSHLILFGGFAVGHFRGSSPARRAEAESLIHLIRQGWGKENPAFRQMFTSLMMPEATFEQTQWFNELQRASASAENAARIVTACNEIDVTHLLPAVQAPTLVLHSREDALIPLEGGRQLAALIPNARFVSLNSRNHLLQEGEPAWQVSLQEIRNFLGTSLAHEPSEPPRPDPHQSREAAAVIAALDHVRLSHYQVIGRYMRYEEGARHGLKDICQAVSEGCRLKRRRRENHLLWAAPGTGKTYLVQELAASLPSVRYVELNLAASDEAKLSTGLAEIDRQTGPTLCLIDEVDSKPQAAWPYELLLPNLDRAVDRDQHVVFILAGSSGSKPEEMQQRIAARQKGADLLSRIPASNRHAVPPLSIGDRLLVALTQLRASALEAGRQFTAVEKVALLFIALSPELANARQLREFAVRSIERAGTTDDRVKYDHLFNPGDPENKRFWFEQGAVVERFAGAFVTVED